MRARWLAVVVVLALPSFAAAGALDYAQALALAERDEATLTPAENDVFLPIQGETAGRAIMACLDTSHPPAHIHVSVVMELDASGRVVRTWREDDAPLTRCFEARIAQAQAGTPPRAPFYTFHTVDLDVTVEQ
ncbi:MAG: hypothetical protein ACREO3_01400 [Arenimonas sp.]